jgi:alanine racemase
VVDLDAIHANIDVVRRHVDGAHVIAVVKANAYGHGAVVVGRSAIDHGASMLAVACVDEALELRSGGISAPILVLGPADPAEYVAAFGAGVMLSLATLEQVAGAERVAERCGLNNATVHLKVETGMNRYGARPEEALDVARLIAGSEHLHLGGVFTHFADADGEDLTFTDQQVQALVRTVEMLVRAGIDPGTVHTSNTAGTFRLGRGVSQAVRLGIGLYGLSPDPSIPLLPGMRPALSLRTRVAQVRQLQRGDTVSYGRTWRADGDENVALLPIGYADGLRRAVSNQGWVGIGGQQAPIRGRVCMDQVVVGRPEVDVRAGTAVTVIGDPSTGAMTMEDVARLTGTINYEIATGIAARVPRWYLVGERPVAHAKGGTVRWLS